MLIPLLLYILFLSAYVLFLIAVFWHLREYTSAQDKYRWVTRVFLFVIAAFIILSAILFALVPWAEFF